MTRLIQIEKGNVRRVALVEEPNVRLLEDCSSIYESAQIAIDEGKSLAKRRANQCETTNSTMTLSIRESEWRLLPAIDHPEESARCHVSGTGTHAHRQRSWAPVHARDSRRGHDGQHEDVSLGNGGVGARNQEASGRHRNGFTKALAARCGRTVNRWKYPAYANDGGEEAEIAGVYIVAKDGRPYRIGMAVGNEFSDHEFEKKNYLNLAGSKLRKCALGPELLVDGKFDSILVVATIVRNAAVLWSKNFLHRRIKNVSQRAEYRASSF